ncbi:hypothetical protein [Streptomyces sp. NPDC056938]|uniref:hypothetical protein n=1 Tax=unclassified Streptomyces TaxID=2593676 RepID=UPI00362C41D2
MLLRLAYLTVTNIFAALRLLPMSDRDKDVESLALRHEITVLERQLGSDRVKLTPEDRAFLAALLAPLPRQVSSCTLRPRPGSPTTSSTSTARSPCGGCTCSSR